MKVFKFGVNSLGYAQVHYIAVAEDVKTATERVAKKIEADGENFDIVNIEQLFDTEQNDYVSGNSDGSCFVNSPESYREIDDE